MEWSEIKNGFREQIYFYILSFFSTKSTCSVSTLYKALMEMAEYVKNRAPRKRLRPKITPIYRKVNQRLTLNASIFGVVQSGCYNKQ